MKIATITLNPAIDQTVFVDQFQVNTVNRGRAMQHDAGGKGVNVASFLADYGLAATATGLLGSDNAMLFERHFAARGIADRFVRVPGLTRIGVKIVDEARQQTTDINMPGVEPPAGAMEELLATIDALAADHDWFVLAGNLPPGLPAETSASIIARLKARGRRVALDVSGAALYAGLRAGPNLAKPNVDELRQISQEALASDEEVARAAQALVAGGVELAIVSMGARGAIFADQTATVLATPPPVTVKSTVGAGDAMVAGTIAGLVQGLDLADRARLATAFSLAKLARVGASLPARPELEALARQVTVTALAPAALPAPAV
jgi:1-phosphofructokinase